MTRDFARVLNELLRKDMNNYADDLANGACKSFDDYQRLCGMIRGLALAEEHLLALLKKVETQDE